MSKPILPHAITLGLISAIGLFAIDIYLPALPEMTSDLGAESAQAQLTLTAFFGAMALCQVFYGPVSDMAGRKRPLYFGLGLFIIGALGSAVAPSIEWLIAFRFLQGMGAYAGLVITRAIVRDLHTGPAAAELMSRLMLVFSVSPIVAPLAGSIIVSFGDWRTIFWVMAGFAVLAIFISVFVLEETRSPEARAQSSLGTALAAYGTLLRDPYYLGLVLIAAFGMSSYMIYVANSSFILIDHYGLSPTAYSVLFSINAVAFIGMSQLNGRLARRFGLSWVIRTASVGYALSMVALAAVTSVGITDLPVIAAMLFVGYGFLGLIIPTSSVLALEAHGRIAGTASALMGTIQFVTAALVVGLGATIFDGTVAPMTEIIGLCATVVFVLTQVTLRMRQSVVAPGE